MTRSLSTAIFAAVMLLGATVLGTNGASAASPSGAAFTVDAQVETVQYRSERDEYRRRPARRYQRTHRRPRCHWELRRVRTSYGWRSKRVRVCRRVHY